MKKLLSLFLAVMLTLPTIASSQVRDTFGMMANTESAQAFHIPTCSTTIGSGLSNPLKAVSETFTNQVWFTEDGTARVRSINTVSNTLNQNILTSSAIVFGVTFATSVNKIFATGRTVGLLNTSHEIDPVAATVDSTLTNSDNNSWNDALYISDNDRVWVVSDGETEVYFINPSTNAIASQTDVAPAQPVQLVEATSVNKVYATDFNGGTVVVLNASTGAVVTTISTTGTAPAGITYVPSTDRIWVANGNEDTIDIINPNTDTVVNTISSSVDFSTLNAELEYYPPADEVILTAASASVSAIGVFGASIEAQIGTSTLPQTTHRGMAYHANNQTLYVMMATAVCAVQ